MVIEWLDFRVQPELREKFIKEDDRIWTPVLADADGFLSKEIWLDPKFSDRIFFVIRWQTREQWFSVSPKLLAETEAKFLSAMGFGSYEMLEGKEYRIEASADGYMMDGIDFTTIAVSYTHLTLPTIYSV